MLLVKLGGSLLTNKGTRGAPRFQRALTRRLLKEVRAGAHGQPVCLVLGAGSFGHPLALQYGIGRRRLTGRRLQDAVVRTQASVRDLRHHVLHACDAAGIPAVDLPASSLAYTRGPHTYLDAALVRLYLASGLIPVTGGDVILDATKGARILSGDEILEHLAAALGAKRVVFATDVDGLRKGRTLLDRVASEDGADALAHAGASGDATGGMRGKLVHGLQIARAGVPVHLVNGKVPGRLQAALAGRKTRGTVLTPTPRRRPTAHQ